jgi:hypothetical protein
LKKILPILVLVSCLAPAMVIAQKKPAPKTRKATPAPTPAPTPAGISNLDAANKVADQLKLVSRFIFVYGKIANGLELAADQAKRGESSPTITARNEQVKLSTVNNIAALKEGIDKVGTELKANDRLQVQYLKLTSASDAVANAQQLAGAGNFDEAGKALVVAVEKLTETIISLR